MRVLTGKQLCFNLFALGHSSRSVAEELQLSYSTVCNYKTIYNKERGLTKDLVQAEVSREETARRLNLHVWEVREAEESALRKMRAYLDAEDMYEYLQMLENLG